MGLGRGGVGILSIFFSNRADLEHFFPQMACIISKTFSTFLDDNHVGFWGDLKHLRLHLRSKSQLVIGQKVEKCSILLGEGEGSGRGGVVLSICGTFHSRHLWH